MAADSLLYGAVMSTRAVVVAAVFVLGGVQSASATSFPIVWGEGADDPTLVEPLRDNPGKTLGEQRRFAHEYVMRLAERVVWIPNETPVPSWARWLDLQGTACGIAWVRTDWRSDPETFLLLDVKRGKAIPYNQQRLQAGELFEINYASDLVKSGSLDPTEVGLVVTGLHEVIHHLGFHGASRQNLRDKDFNSFDLHIRYQSNPQPLDKLSQEMRDSLADAHGVDDTSTTVGDFRWEGPATKEAAPGLLMAGQEDGRVFLDARSGWSLLSHLSTSLRPYSIMGPGARRGQTTLELGIVAYMLSDLGWGPVVDTAISASADREVVTATVAVEGAIAADDRLVITATPPTGVSATAGVATPAECQVDSEQRPVCVYRGYSGPVDIPFAFTGKRGVHLVEVDVDHQADHVDPKPVNNFATVAVAIGENTIEDVNLSKQSVAEGQPRGTPVGTLEVVSDVAGLAHAFELAEGGRHNACFRLEGDDGERLVTAKPFDREGAASLGIRVRARAENGFTRERDFTVEVTPAAVASGWTWSVAAHADTGGAALSLRSLALAALLLFIAGYALRSSPGRSKGSRIALALAALLLVASCGGGGGSSSSAPPAPPPPPPPPAFTC